MDFIANIETEINNFLAQVDSLISLVQAYVVFSSIVLVLVLIMVAVALSKLSEIEKQNEHIMEMIESRTLKGGEKKNE